MDTYLFGAGASKSYGVSPTNQKMPLANEFFTIFNNLKICGNPWVLVGKTINYVQETYGVNPFEFTNFNDDIERLNSVVYEKFRVELSNKNMPEAMWLNAIHNELTFIFTSILNEIQNGPTSKFYKTIAANIGSNDVLITYNWDTLLDIALFENSSWCCDTGYSFCPNYIYRNEWVKPENNLSEVLLLKLHGSTNWLTSHTIFSNEEPTFSHVGKPSDINVFESTLNPYPCFDGRYMAGYRNFTYGYYPPNILAKPNVPDGYTRVRSIMRNGQNVKGESPEYGVESMPLIIPPIQDKEYDKYGSLFKQLWLNASIALTESDRIFIVGYSFPQTDTATISLFTTAFISRKQFPEIIIINPFPEGIVDLFKYKFGIKEKYIHVDKCFLDDDYNMAKW